MAVNCLAMTIGLYLFCSLILFCSFVYPNYLVCLCHLDHHISLVLAVTTTPLWTLRIAKCWSSRTQVMVPYEWVWIMGPCLLSSNLRPFHDELVERVRILFLSPLLFSILVDPVRCGLSPSLFDVYCSLDSIPSILVVCYGEWIKGSWIPCPPPLVLSCLSPCMLVPI